MALTVTHAKTSAVADSGDSSLVQPSDWNAGHTVSGTVGTSNIDDDAVTNAKLANMAASTIKARKTASTGDPEDATIQEVLALAAGTSFPGSPATGNRFYRTDRNIEYFYDGTQWLSTQLFVLFPSPETSATNGITASTGSQRVGNPWAGLYDIYVETFQASTILTNGTTGTNYYTLQAQTGDGASTASLGSSTSTQNDTQNARTLHRVTINTVVSSAVETLEVLITESGVATLFLMPTFTYRLVG